MAKNPSANREKWTSRDQAVLDRLEQLRSEYDELNKKRIQTQTMVQSLEEQLEQLKKQAEAEYGTSDVAQLETLLEERRRDNEQRVAAYEQHIRGIQERLHAVEAETARDET